MKIKEPPESDSDSAQLASTANTSRPLASGNTSTPYIIGGQTLEAPLVTIQQVKAHLCLLRAFKDLRAAVEATPTELDKSQLPYGTSEWPELVKKLDGPSRWIWFLGIAVDKYVPCTWTYSGCVADIWADFSFGSKVSGGSRIGDPPSWARARCLCFNTHFHPLTYSWFGTRICSIPCEHSPPR